MARPPIQRIGIAELREKFDRLYLADALGGRLDQIVESRRAPSRRNNQPAGTMSETVSYYRGEHRVARIHRYVLPDGSLGGSGIEDPLAVWENGVLYMRVLKPRPPRTRNKRRGKRRR